MEALPYGIVVVALGRDFCMGNPFGRDFSMGNPSVQRAFDAARLREARSRVGRGSQTRGRLTKSWQARGARQARPASLTRGSRHTPLARFAVQSLARDARETWGGEWDLQRMGIGVWEWCWYGQRGSREREGEGEMGTRKGGMMQVGDLWDEP